MVTQVLVFLLIAPFFVVGGLVTAVRRMPGIIYNEVMSAWYELSVTRLVKVMDRLDPDWQEAGNTRKFWQDQRMQKAHDAYIHACARAEELDKENLCEG